MDLTEGELVRDTPDIEVEELSPQEIDDIVDAMARRYLGISGEEFRCRWEAREITEDDHPGVTRIVMLLPVPA